MHQGGPVRDLLDRARREVDAGLVPGCQLALARNGELELFEAVGDATTTDRYVVFSCTKGIVAGAVWLLLGDGRLRLDDRVADLVPSFATNGKDAVTIEHLLTHTGGFARAPLGTIAGGDRARRHEAFARWRLFSEPGARYEYHPTSGHWVLGEVVEVVTGDDLRTFVQRELVEALGLPTFSLGAALDRQDGIRDLVVTGEEVTADELAKVTGRADIVLADMLGEVTPENLLEFNRPEARAVGVPGAGGVGSAADLALYYQAVLHNPGERWKPDLLADATRRIWCDLPEPLLPTTAKRCLGLQVAGEPPGAQIRAFPHGCSPATFGHDGAGGQVAWVDPESGISFSYLTNGLDRHIFREARRKIGIGSRAVACA